MTHRERFHAVVNRAGADRVAFDLCGSPQTGIDHPDLNHLLTLKYGFAGPKKGIWELDERILERYNVDTRRIGGMPTPQTIHNRTENEVSYDCYGIGYKLVGGHFEICHNPLTDCTIDEMLAWPMPESADIDMSYIEKWAAQAQYLQENTDYAVVAEHPILGVFELGCWMFGFDDYLYRLAAEPEIVHAFSKRVLEYQKSMIEKYYGKLGAYIDCTTSGDDFGMQTGSFMSPAMFTESIAPYLKERVRYTKLFTNAYYKHHSCGSIHALIPTIIDCGVDILNPIQPGTYRMEPERIKKDYGDKICFWGGVDTQHLLPEGTSVSVEKRIHELLNIFSENKGFVLSPAHRLQEDVPADNVDAMYKSAIAHYKR